MSKNGILICIAVVILLVAGVLFVRNTRKVEVDNSAAADAPQLVTCSKCGYSWEVPFSKYEELTAGGKLIVCEKCGAQEAYGAGGVAGAVAPPPLAVADPTAPSINEGDEEVFDPETPTEKPKRPMAGRVRD